MKNKLKETIPILLSLIICLTFSIDLSKTDIFVKNFNNINYIIYVIIFSASYYFLKNKSLGWWDKRLNKSSLILAMLISLSYIIFFNYNNGLTIVNLFVNALQTIKTIIVFLGYTTIFYYAIKMFYDFLDNISLKENKLSKITNFIFEEHPFISTLVILLLCYLPIIIIFYPGIVNGDFLDEMYQYYHENTWSLNYINLLDERVFINGHHSPFHTVIIGLINTFGYNISSANLGLFLNVIVQSTFMILGLSYTMKLFKDIKCPILVRKIILLIYILSPFYNLHTSTLFKDVPFSISIMIYSCVLIKFIKANHTDNKKSNIILFIEFIFSGFLVTLFSNKGFYILILTIFVMVFVYRKKGIIFIICLCLPLILFKTYDKILLPTLKVTPGSIQETLSIPIQQISRTILEHEDGLTETDIEIISKLLPYKNIKELYDPTISDPIKNKFNKDYKKDDILKFLKVWIKLGVKYPMTYVDAFLDNYRGNLYITNTVSPAYFISSKRKNIFPQVDYVTSEKRLEIIANLSDIYTGIRKMPLVNLFFSLAVYNWLLIIAAAYILKKYSIKEIIPLMPSLVIFVFLFLSPVGGNRRYNLPIIYCIPVIYAYIFSLSVNLKSKKK